MAAAAPRFGDDRATDVMRRIAEATSAREHERFEHTTDSGGCRVAVDLRGRLVDVVFLESNALRRTDRETLAAELTAAVTAAQSRAADEVAEIVSRITDDS